MYKYTTYLEAVNKLADFIDKLQNLERQTKFGQNNHTPPSSLYHAFGMLHKNVWALPCSIEILTYLRVSSSKKLKQKGNQKIWIVLKSCFKSLKKNKKKNYINKSRLTRCLLLFEFPPSFSGEASFRVEYLLLTLLDFLGGAIDKIWL